MTQALQAVGYNAIAAAPAFGKRAVNPKNPFPAQQADAFVRFARSNGNGSPKGASNHLPHIGQALHWIWAHTFGLLCGCIPCCG